MLKNHVIDLEIKILKINVGLKCLIALLSVCEVPGLILDVGFPRAFDKLVVW